jgi:amidase
VLTSDAVRPPVIRWVSDRLGRPAQRGDLDDAVFDAAARHAARDKNDVRAAQDAIAAAAAPILDWWDDHDLLVTPTTFQPAWPLGGNPGPREMGTLLAPFSLTGQPALSLPLHQTENGLPVGIQLVGGHGADELLLRLAEDLQTVADWTTRRPRCN